MRRLFLIAAGLVLAALLVIYLFWWAPGPKAGPHDVIVKEGTTLGAVSRQLAKEGAIPGTARTYYVMARLFGSHDPVQAGEFEIPKGMGGASVLDLLQHGKPLLRLLTVTEGMPSVTVEEKLAATPYLAGPLPDVPEGSVLPDSYGYQRGERRAALVKRMQAAMTKALGQLWAKRSNDCPLATPEQAIILASIVEKETGKADERGRVAAVTSDDVILAGLAAQDPQTQVVGRTLATYDVAISDETGRRTTTARLTCAIRPLEA